MQPTTTPTRASSIVTLRYNKFTEMKFSLLFFSFILFLSLFILPQIVLSRPVKQTFKSFKHLEGCHKGQTVKGLYELKQYLEKFGYLSYTHQSNKSLAAHANGDEFDDLLEAAVKTYQLNYNLNITGAIDSQTVKQMMVPRCGVADIINGTSWMRSGKRGHYNGSNTLHSIPPYSFFPDMPKWPAYMRDLTYSFHSSAQISAAKDLQSVCSKAFSRWAKRSWRWCPI
ncbi:metalloendoproteinase 2-MMP-like isoform X2 [Macadamia integrifolia]|uniref:metalloendoproteinase 2-MMP-like isoform X2 n=1 Tax=Macadamia integrifolia TaxID=60698 RepID=UPI001C4EE1D7|nr:metalloendoproteinase 2-MMP-like isoform X2 [Macadamia integrifolia]